MTKALVFTAPDCPHSKNLKDFLTKKRVEIEEKNVLAGFEVIEELHTVSGQMAIPVTVIGENVFVGFNRRVERRINRNLGT
ncbi:MAG: glutaredoxin domain-containing protein [Candidatus Thorarchaeota archaeon]|jgi:glutaredoxin